MNSLFLSNLQTNFSNIRRKFLSSIAIIENPSILQDGYGSENPHLDPLELFKKRINSEKPTLRYTKSLHTHLLKSDTLHTNMFFANSLVDCYSKSADMSYALKVFEGIPQPNSISWNILISGYSRNFLPEETWRMFCRMHSLSFESNQFTYGSVLSACSAMRLPLYGKLVYALVTKNGFFSDAFVLVGMISLLCEHGDIGDALRLFGDLSCDNEVCWNAVISGAVKNKENWIALDLFSQMHSGLISPNSFTFSSILTACAALEELDLGRAVQGLAIRSGAGDDLFVGTATIDLYAKCGRMDEAIEVFKCMPVHNVVCWTTVISGFVQNGDSISALNFFKKMRELREEVNNYTVTSVITSCADPAMLREAMQIHCWIYKSKFYADSTVKSSLVNMYSKIGEIEIAERVFKETGDLDHMGLWAVMVIALVQNGSSERAIDMFAKMFQEGLKPDKFCTSSVLSVVSSLNLGRQIHCYVVKAALVFDVSVGSSLFTMYSKCGNLVDSFKVFKQVSKKDNVSWASMISGFAEHGCGNQAIQLFRELLLQDIEFDEMAFTAVLAACSDAFYLNRGKEIHGHALRRGFGKNVMISSALLNMYCKCSSLNKARKVFDTLNVKDPISYSSLVSAYAQHGCIEEVIQVFHEMLMANIEVDSYTLSSIFRAASLINKVSLSTQLHSLVTKTGLASEASVGSSLVVMYSKCGSIHECRKAFNQIENPDLISWTAMIMSYAQHGQGVDALKVYELMKNFGVKPDAVTFVGVLSACSHNGLVEEGYFHLNSMVKDYEIEPGYEHYACMVDILGRSGRLKEAENFINNMPVKPDAFVWGTLLAACKTHGDVELGRLVARKVIELDPSDAGAYVALSNICANAGDWEEVTMIRHTMKGTGMKKDPGWSYV